MSDVTQQEPQEAAVDRFEGEYDSIVEPPRGGLVWKPQMGVYVREFTSEQDEDGRLILEGMTGSKSFLNYHVPVVYRGIYRVADLPRGYTKGIDWKTDDRGFVKCTSQKKDGTDCEALAQHRSAVCPNHGARLHPLDKRPTINEKLGPHINADQVTGLNISELTRWQQLLAGHISVEDLDDEELSRGQCRMKNGKFSKAQPKMIPKALHDRMAKQLIVRAQEKFQQGLFGAIDALNEIASGTAYEPADRIKAAGMVIDRVMGKTPDVINMTVEQKPWETIFEAISRDTGDNEAFKRIEAAVDAEVVEIDDQYDQLEKLEKPEWGPGLNPGQMRNDLKEIPPVTDTGEPHPDHIGPWNFPPDDPLDRESYEVAKQEIAIVAEDAQSLRDKVKRQRSKRFAARAQGRTDVESVAFGAELIEISAPTEEFEGLYRLKLIPPENFKVPKNVLSKEARSRRYERDRRA